MGQKKGQTGNPNGRPKGTPNKTTVSMREKISKFCNENWEQIQNDFEKLEPIDRIKTFEKFLQYTTPKMSESSLRLDYDSMSDEQLQKFAYDMLKDSQII